MSSTRFKNNKKNNASEGNFDSPDFLFSIAMVLDEKGKREEALEFLHDIFEEYNYGPACQMLGILYMETNFKKSELYLKKAIEVFKLNELYYELGLLYWLQRNDIDSAIAYFEKYIELGLSEPGKAYLGIGLLLNNTKDSCKALESFHKAADGYDNFNALCNLATYYFNEKNHEKSEYYIKKAIDHAEFNYETNKKYSGNMLFLLGMLTLTKGNNKDTEKHLKKAVDLNQPNAFLVLGTLYAKSSQFDKAMPLLQVASKKYPQARSWLKHIEEKRSAE